MLIFAVNAIFLFHDKKINTEHPFRMYIPYENNLFYLYRDRKYLRNPAGVEFGDKKPLVLYGCSYSFGYLLKENEAFAAKLSEITKRPVYNYSISSKGIQNMLYFLEKDDHFGDFSEPEYVIYTFIDDHVRRLFTPCNANDNIEFIEYKTENNDLIRKNTPLKYLHSLYIFNKLQNFLYNKFLKHQKENENMDLVIKYFEKSKELLEKHCPNTKFIILLYPTGSNNYINSNKWSELEEKGFIILNINDLTQKDMTKSEYKLADNVHPNAAAWEIITKSLKEKFIL